VNHAFVEFVRESWAAISASLKRASHAGMTPARPFQIVS